MGSTPSEQISDIHEFSYRPIKVWSTAKISLKIAFFDYGVCASPFEYETEDDNGNIIQELRELEEIFKKQYENQLSIPFDPKYKWSIGKLDAYLKRGRYSPLYYDNIGVVSNKFLMNRAQFQSSWEEAFNQAIIHFLTPAELQSQQIIKQKNNLFQMDWIHYRTFVVYSYRDEKLTFDEIVANRVATRYLLYMKEKFQSKVINDKYKIEKLLRRLTKFELDILFLQDIDQKILSYIEKKTNSYRIVRCQLSKSAILISLKAIREIVGDSIRPLYHYNKKYLDPNQTYELSPQSSISMDETGYGASFEDRQHRNFEFITIKLKKKKTSAFSNPVEATAKVQSPMKKGASAKLGPDEQEKKPQNSETKVEETENAMPRLKTQTMDKEDINKKQELQIKTFIPPELFKGLFWNDSTIVQFLSNIILITSTFDLDVDPDQEKYMLDSLAGLKETFPHHVIIAAIDIQKDIHEVPGYYVFPNLKENKMPTMYKRKTLLQPKVHRAKQLIQNTEDYIISTVPLEDPQVVDINYNEMGENPKLTPNENHPYDHYFISGTVSCNVTRKILKSSLKN